MFALHGFYCCTETNTFLIEHWIARNSQLKEMNEKLRKSNIRWKFSQLLAWDPKEINQFGLPWQ